mmetsp:Transcript_38409/g.80527  ORF Transcript_38409/g.80527 Transcript_38409/m.80527 type:complete len:89 (+) Transcript_38409:543-809(+)
MMQCFSAILEAKWIRLTSTKSLDLELEICFENFHSLRFLSKVVLLVTQEYFIIAAGGQTKKFGPSTEIHGFDPYGNNIIITIACCTPP